PRCPHGSGWCRGCMPAHATANAQGQVNMRIESPLPPLFRIVLTASALALVGACETEDRAVPEETPPGNAPAEPTEAAAGRFTADLSPLAAEPFDSNPAGVASLETRGDSLTVMVNAMGLPPAMVHLQHFHGFEDGSPARCPGSDADANGDGGV